jgi:hypothetical protein
VEGIVPGASSASMTLGIAVSHPQGRQKVYPPSRIPKSKPRSDKIFWNRQTYPGAAIGLAISQAKLYFALEVVLIILASAK